MLHDVEVPRSSVSRAEALSDNARVAVPVCSHHLNLSLLFRYLHLNPLQPTPILPLQPYPPLYRPQCFPSPHNLVLVHLPLYLMVSILGRVFLGHGIITLPSLPTKLRTFSSSTRANPSSLLMNPIMRKFLQCRTAGCVSLQSVFDHNELYLTIRV